MSLGHFGLRVGRRSIAGFMQRTFFLQHATSDKERHGSATASLLYYFLFQNGVLATVPASAWSQQQDHKHTCAKAAH